LNEIPDAMIGEGERQLGRRQVDGDTPMPFVEDLSAMLRAHTFRFLDEYDLQAAVGGLLADAGYYVRPEYRLGPRERVDFMVGEDGHAVVIEVKVAGQVPAVTRQLLRYAAHHVVTEVLLVTSCRRHLSVPRSDGEKRIGVVLVESA
jgi:hypothetical protein